LTSKCIPGGQKRWEKLDGASEKKKGTRRQNLKKAGQKGGHETNKKECGWGVGKKSDRNRRDEET